MRSGNIISISMATASLLLGGTAGTALAQPTVDWDPDGNVLTVGPNNEFTVGIYQIVADADMADAAGRGFNMVHSYSFGNEAGTQYPGQGVPTPEQFLTRAASHGLSVMMQLGVNVPDEPDVPLVTPEDVSRLSTHGNIAWWSIVPEEISWWPQEDNAKFAQLQQWAGIIHQNDPQERPVYHYLASNYAEMDLKAYTGFLDALSAGAYADHGSKPRPWIRWRIEQEVNAITNTGNRDGLFPVAVLQMFASENFPGETMMEAADGYHDAWLSLVAGAKAVVVFTGGRRGEIPGLYGSYSRFAREINNEQRLGDVFLFGKDLGEFAPIKPVIIAGPDKSAAFTEAFVWPETGPTIQYDSISYRAMAYEGHIYIAAVNSAEEAVDMVMPGIRSSKPLDVLFQDRQINAEGNKLADHFDPLGVNIYRLPAEADLIVMRQTFDEPVNAWTPRAGDGTIVNTGDTSQVRRGSSATEYFLHDLEAGQLPPGAFLELRVKADTETAFYLELVSPDGSSAALIDWQPGTGDWQTVRAAVHGDWRSGSALWLGIRADSAEVAYEIESLGIYYSASILGATTPVLPEPASAAMLISAGATLLGQRPVHP